MFANDIGKAKNAASELQWLFSRVPTIDTWSDDGIQLPSAKGGIEFRDVRFSYPTRRSQPVLKGLSLTVQPGQCVALVGASGCGKSTVISLLERFYDPDCGAIYLDGIDISIMNVNRYLSFISLVGQEPTLFKGTLREKNENHSRSGQQPRGRPGAQPGLQGSKDLQFHHQSPGWIRDPHQQQEQYVFVLDAGDVVEVGTHSELLRERGKYFELAKLQNLA